MNIITIPNKILRMKSKRIGFVDDSIRKLANEMIKTTIAWDHKSEFGAALAAIQVGEPLKLTVVRNDFDNPEKQEFTTLINPEIVKKSPDEIADIEGCMSVPSVYGRVRRARKIKVKALNEKGGQVRLTLEGFPARVLQHEIDHMAGVIFLDHITDTSELYHIDAQGNLSPINASERDELQKAQKS